MRDGASRPGEGPRGAPRHSDPVGRWASGGGRETKRAGPQDVLLLSRLNSGLPLACPGSDSRATFRRSGRLGGALADHGGAAEQSHPEQQHAGDARAVRSDAECGRAQGRTRATLTMAPATSRSVAESPPPFSPRASEPSSRRRSVLGRPPHRLARVCARVPRRVRQRRQRRRTRRSSPWLQRWASGTSGPPATRSEASRSDPPAMRAARARQPPGRLRAPGRRA